MHVPFGEKLSLSASGSSRRGSVEFGEIQTLPIIAYEECGLLQLQWCCWWLLRGEEEEQVVEFAKGEQKRLLPPYNRNEFARQTSRQYL